MRARRPTGAPRLVAIGALAVAAVGCGGSSRGSAPPTTVPHAAPCLAVVGTLLGRPVRLVLESLVPEDLTCDFAAVVPPATTCGTVRVIVDTDPQPYTDFNRWEVETGQNATQVGAHRADMYPALIGGIGLAADWVPVAHELDAVDTSRWVRIFLTCPPGVSGLHQAEALARRALVTPLG